MGRLKGKVIIVGGVPATYAGSDASPWSPNPMAPLDGRHSTCARPISPKDPLARGKWHKECQDQEP